MPRMRLIKEAYEELKAQDPETPLTEYTLRRMVKMGKIPGVYIGNRYLINMDMLERAFGSPNICSHIKSNSPSG